MPLWNFFRVIKNKDVTFLLKDREKLLGAIKDRICPEELLNKLIEVWSDLDYQFIDEFGVSKEKKTELMLRKDLLDSKISLELKGGHRFKTNIKRIETALALLSGSDSGNDNFSYRTLISSVSKQVGYRIKEKETTVAEFYGDIEALKNNS
jgi:hypothetical protein